MSKQTDARKLANDLMSVEDGGGLPLRAAKELLRLEAENEALRIDAECFRFWVREAEHEPVAMATLIMRCVTEQDYRDAIIPVMMMSKTAISKAISK